MVQSSLKAGLNGLLGLIQKKGAGSEILLLWYHPSEEVV